MTLRNGLLGINISTSTVIKISMGNHCFRKQDHKEFYCRKCHNHLLKSCSRFVSAFQFFH